MLPEITQPLGVGAAVIADIVTALFDAGDDVRIILAYQAVEKDGGRQLQFLEQAEDAPDADAQSVIAPRIVALRLRTVGAQIRIVAAARHEREVLDIERHVKGKPLALGPSVIAPLLDRRIVITIMYWQLEHCPTPTRLRPLITGALPFWP